MSKVYQIVTDMIIKQLEDGTVPWHKPWSGGQAINYVSRKAYRGVNVFLLQRSGEYLTFKQIQTLKGRVKKGAKAEMVVFFKVTLKEEKNDDGSAEMKKSFILRYYNVFHISDTEGIESKLKTFEHNPVMEAEKVIDEYVGCPQIKHDDSGAAYYSPTKDFINIPDMNLFDKVEEYYSTLFHEAVHSTGHKDRLDRFEQNQKMSMFGSEDYSKEELVAELGASMLSYHVGSLESTVDNSAAYIKSWIRVLQNDEKFVIQASSKAQKAVDHILGIKFDKED